MTYAIEIAAARPPSLSISESATALCARQIAEEFQRYCVAFRRLTQRAAVHFQHRDWSGSQMDDTERRRLCEYGVGRVARVLDEQALRGRWQMVRMQYEAALEPWHDNALAREFFSGVQRACERQSSQCVSNRVESSQAEQRNEHVADGAELQRHACTAGMVEAVRALLISVRLEAEWQGIEHDVERISQLLRTRDAVRTIEQLTPVFYRGTRAYIVGCLCGERERKPFAIAIRNGEEGALVDEVLLGEAALIELFGRTRTSFHVDARSLADIVAYLRNLMPALPFAQLATVLGWPMSTLHTAGQIVEKTVA